MSAPDTWLSSGPDTEVLTMQWNNGTTGRKIGGEKVKAEEQKKEEEKTSKVFLWETDWPQTEKVNM